ncbi:MAG TPA: ATP-binding protein [Steroidobacteraceae bacterium]|nr:ATP-binding protein [Steroidobacteraceae bacterium]
MTELLNALLDISRLESGAITPLQTDVRLKDVFAELRDEFEPMAEEKGIRLRIDGPAPVVSTDRILFSQIFQNLLGNAFKYTERGSVSLSAAFEEDAFVITVADTGVGIPADKLGQIFDEYFQVDGRGAQRAGVGLGLAIVKEIAHLLGFSVRISSEVGAGTQVRVYVPGSLVLTPTPVHEPGVEPAKVTGALRKPRVILVEDNDGVRMATELFLKVQGHETVSARSVSEAEQLTASMRAGDVVIADYHLEGSCNGLELLARLRERVGEEVPGVILSGDLPAVIRSISAPVPRCRFLGKPVDTGALIEAIHELSAPPDDPDRAAAG